MKTLITFLAFSLHLEVAELKRCLATEDLHHNFEFFLLIVDFFDHATETGERSVVDCHGLAYNELEFRTFAVFCHLVNFS